MAINNTQPLLSVRLMTYNHEAFIEEALRSIDMQQTNFPFEVVIGDDFSSDKTLEIIKEFKFSKPNITVNALDRKKGDHYHKERLKKGRIYNFIDILNNCKGKYIALLDGDDYWTDPLKLQKQVDFLEGNEGYVICEHVVEQVNQNNKVNKLIPAISDCKDFSIQDYILNNIGATCSLMFRKKSLDVAFFEKLHSYPFADWPLKLYLLKNSNQKSRVLKDVMAVYRIHDKSIHGSFHTKKKGLITAYKQHLSFINLIQKDLLEEKVFQNQIIKKKFSTLSTILKLTDNSFEKLLYFFQFIYLKLLKRLK